MKKKIKAIIKPFYHFFAFYITNYLIAFVPIRFVRNFWYKCVLQTTIGKKTYIDMGIYFMCPWRLQIGSFTHINRRCFIDSRASVKIGNSVCISHSVSIITASHDINSKKFLSVEKEIVIGDYVFVGANATILQGVSIGTGAVVCAGSVVTKNIEPYSVVAGVPAKVISKRTKILDYGCNPHTFFF